MQPAQFHLHADIEDRHWWFVARRQIMRCLVEVVLPPSPGATVVDVGCGTGASLAALAGDYDCVGIDTSAEAIDRARARFPQLRFLVGRAPEDLGEIAGRARLFLLMDVLEHVPDDFAMLSELLSAMTPGGYLLLTVPADDSLWSEHDESFGHFRRYDLKRLARLWKGLAVTPLLLSYFNARLLPLVRMVRAVSRLRGRAAGRSGSDFWLPTPPANAALRAAFAGEARRLLATLDGRCHGYTAGASLVAVLRREEGPIATRSKPADLAPDRRLSSPDPLARGAARSPLPGP